MRAIEKDMDLRIRVWNLLGGAACPSTQEANTIRRAALTLTRWGEQECGDSNGYASWGIERDPETGTPYRVTYPHNGGKTRRTRIPDRERGALARVATICAAYGLHYYHQTDPRGISLYLGVVPLDAKNYSRDGIAVY